MSPSSPRSTANHRRMRSRNGLSRSSPTRGLRSRSSSGWSTPTMRVPRVPFSTAWTLPWTWPSLFRGSVRRWPRPAKWEQPAVRLDSPDAERPEDNLDDGTAIEPPEVATILPFDASRRSGWGGPTPCVTPLDLCVTLSITGLPRLDTSLVPAVREARMLSDPPWVRGVGPLELRVQTDGWKFPAPPADLAPTRGVRSGNTPCLDNSAPTRRQPKVRPKPT